MASLKKRRKTYYIKLSKTINGRRETIVRSLGIRNKKDAEQALEELERMEKRGELDPFAQTFDPKRILREKNKKEQPLTIYTVREAADYFYRLKSHLSNKTINGSGGSKAHREGAYEQAIEHFIRFNNIAKLPPSQVSLSHFEAVIFKPNIKPATRHFFFRQLRVWWNVLLDRSIVKVDHLAAIKKHLPKKKSNTRKKMLTESELQILFNTFDKELFRKRAMPEWEECYNQHWFKPLMAIYFYGGLRKNEAAYDPDLEYSGLKGRNVVFEDGEPAMIYLEATKGQRERFIPISSQWREHLNEYLNIQRDVGYGEYLFIYLGPPKKGWPVTGHRAYRQFKHYLKKGKTTKNRTLHGMRHERVTKWLEDGFNTCEAQFMAGHSSVKVTEQYTHLTGKNLHRKQRLMDKKDN